jgi:hypothetical protein
MPGGHSAGRSVSRGGRHLARCQAFKNRGAGTANYNLTYLCVMRSADRRGSTQSVTPVLTLRAAGAQRRVFPETASGQDREQYRWVLAQLGMGSSTPSQPFDCEKPS